MYTVKFNLIIILNLRDFYSKNLNSQYQVKTPRNVLSKT